MCNAIYLNPTIEEKGIIGSISFMDHLKQFSREYQNILFTCQGEPDYQGYGSTPNYKYHPIKLGWIYSTSNTVNNWKLSYRDIKPETTIDYDGKGEIKNKATIENYSVYLNGVLIAIAPPGKNKAFKEKFCKAVIWQLQNDPTTLQDKLAEISKPAMPEKIPGYIAYLGLSIIEEVITA